MGKAKRIKVSNKNVPKVSLAEQIELGNDKPIKVKNREKIRFRDSNSDNEEIFFKS